MNIYDFLSFEVSKIVSLPETFARTFEQSDRNYWRSLLLTINAIGDHYYRRSRRNQNGVRFQINREFDLVIESL